VPGLFAAGECAAGINGANRLGGNSLSDIVVFGQRAGEYAAQFAKTNALGELNSAELEEISAASLESFSRATGENPYSVQKDLQELMQANVGIVRNEAEMQKALEGLGQLKKRVAEVGVVGHREFNPGWHTAIDLRNLLTVSEAITRAALMRKESRGAQFRDDYPDKSAEFSKVNTMIAKASDGSMQVRLEPLSEMPERLKEIIKEMG